MREILFKLVAKKMDKKRLGSYEPVRFNITLEVPLWFGESIIQLIKEKAKEVK